MSLLQKTILKLPPALQHPLVQLMYTKRGHKMKSMKSYFDNAFFIYEVDGYFIPSDSLGWFVDYDYYKDWVYKTSAWAYKPKEGDVVIDIGSGMGEECLLFSDMVGKSGVIHSIEANPNAFIILKDVVALNKLDNVRLYNCAVNNENSVVRLKISSEDSFIAGSIGSKSSKENEFEVQGVRMDSFLEKNDIARVDLLKSNIEGAERFIIESLGSEIRRIRNVAISCHDFRYKNEGVEFFKTRDMVTAYLTDNNFILSSQLTETDHINDWIYGTNKLFL